MDWTSASTLCRSLLGVSLFRAFSRGTHGQDSLATFIILAPGSLRCATSLRTWWSRVRYVYGSLGLSKVPELVGHPLDQLSTFYPFVCLMGVLRSEVPWV